MEGWKYWLKKKVYIRLKNGRVFSGVVQQVDDSAPPLVWIAIVDRYWKRVQFVHSEILEIKEEE